MRDEGLSSTATEKFVVRLPKGMRRTISDAARQHRRSMNSEIVAIIDRALVDIVFAGNAFTECPTTGVSALEQTLLRRIRALPEQKRRALLEFLD